MKIFLDRQSPKPMYIQIQERINHLIKSGVLQPSERLPSIRSLAASLQINKQTVMDAYNALYGDGIVSVRQGAGYFVDRINSPSVCLNSTFAPAQEVIIPEQRNGSFLKNIYSPSVQARTQESMLNLGGGFSSYAPKDIDTIAKRALRQHAEACFHYDLPEGQLPLRRQIRQILVQLGLEVLPENLIITNGSEQGLSLVMYYYVQPGDWVIVEVPTYYGAIAILESLGARIIGIPMTNEGMNLDLLEQHLHSHRPKLIYTISTLHNPTGITTTQDHRQNLLALAEKHNCPILEDNAYEGLNFTPVPAPIKALDKQHLVTYIGTFSKTIMPGLRVGYLVVTGKHYQPILERKLLHDFHTSTVSQVIVKEYLASGLYRRNLNQLRSENLQSRNAMLQAMECYFPQVVRRWTIPEGGLFLWVQLPENVPQETFQTIHNQALAQNIFFAHGSAFFPDRQGYPAMRLNFSLSLDKIKQGISILGELLRSHFG